MLVKELGTQKRIMRSLALSSSLTIEAYASTARTRSSPKAAASWTRPSWYIQWGRYRLQYTPTTAWLSDSSGHPSWSSCSWRWLWHSMRCAPSNPVSLRGRYFSYSGTAGVASLAWLGGISQFCSASGGVWVLRQRGTSSHVGVSWSSSDSLSYDSCNMNDSATTSAKTACLTGSDSHDALSKRTADGVQAQGKTPYTLQVW